MNNVESSERQQIIKNQTKALEEAENKADNLADLAAGGGVSKERYERKLAEAEATIKHLRGLLNQTLNNASDWREAMRKTLDVLFNGRERFDNGNVFVKREVLQSLGSNIVIKDKKLMIDTYKWLEPIKNNYKTLEARFDEVRTRPQQIQKASFEAIRSDWRDTLDEVRAIMLGCEHVYYSDYSIGLMTIQ
jgi:DNA repair exonuclease SbcCD ATPase subunit